MIVIPIMRYLVGANIANILTITIAASSDKPISPQRIYPQQALQCYATSALESQTDGKIYVPKIEIAIASKKSSTPHLVPIAELYPERILVVMSGISGWHNVCIESVPASVLRKLRTWHEVLEAMKGTPRR